jgi:hypothetical protein
MTTDSGPFVWPLYARRATMPTILHDNNTDQLAAEQTSCEISRNVAMALRATGITQSGQAPATGFAVVARRRSSPGTGGCSRGAGLFV